MGRAIRATAQNRDAAQLMGVAVNRVYFQVLVLSGAIAGICGVMVSSMTQLSPPLGNDPMLKAFIMCVVAGLGNLPGAVAAAFGLALLEAFVQYVAGARWGFPTLLFVVIARPDLAAPPAFSAGSRSVVCEAAMTPISRSARLDLLVSLLLIAAAVTLPFMVDSRYVLGQVVLALFYATIASQWNLLFGFAGVFSLAQMAMFAFGGYATAMICFYFGWNVWAALVPGALGAVVFSLVVGLACLRLTGVYVALLTLAIAQTMYLLIVTDTECFVMVGSICRQFTGGAVGFARFGDLGTRALLKGQWLVGNYAIIATLFTVTMIVTYIIVKSPIGLAFRALKDNPGYAVARGVNRFQAQLLVFGISAFFTGLAGGFYAAHFQAIGPRHPVDVAADVHHRDHGGRRCRHLLGDRSSALSCWSRRTR
jgi:branched-chain amino acid transport system permease protein